MRLSERDIFSKAQPVTGTAFSENIKDLGEQTPDYGGGTFSPFIIATVAANFAGPGTLTYQLVNGDLEDLSDGEVIYSGEPLAAADLEMGAEIAAPRIPSGTLKRYLGVRYVVAGGEFTAGAVNTFLTLDRQMNRYYKRGFDV